MIYLDKLVAFLNMLGEHTIFGINIWRSIFAFLIFAGIMLLRGIFKRFLFNSIKKLTAKFRIADKIIDALQPCIETLFIIAAIWISFSVLSLEKGEAFINTVVRSMLIFIVAWAIYRLLEIVIYFFLQKSSVTDSMLDDYLVVFAGKALKILVITVGIVMALQEWGYNVTTLIAGLGVGGLAIALAGQQSVANVFGFLTIFMDRSFVVGDWIKTPDVEGFVEDIGMRSTKVRTFDRALVTLPNSLLAGGQITNWSKSDRRRINFALGVTYSSTAEQMDKLSNNIKKMLAEHPDVYKDEIWVYFSEFGGSSLDILLNFFTEKPVTRQEYYVIKHDINLKIMKLVEELGMSVAFPSRSIYLENFDTQALNLLNVMRDTKQV